MKKTVAWILTAAVTASLLSGCTPEPAPTESPQPTGQVETEGTYIPGSYTATAKGYGGDVSVTVTVDADAITQVTVDAPDETADIGGKAAETLESAIMEAQSAQVDGVSGATFTSDAVKEAAERALLEATGQAGAEQEEETQPLSMTAGTYTGEAEGFGGIVRAQVTVSETAIESITLENIKIENPLIDQSDPLSMYTASMDMETPQFFKGVEERLPGRIVEAQSLAVDTITGATATSHAVLSAVEAALLEAGATEDMLYGAVEKKSGQETYDCDIVVVGGGTSGSTAAAQATELGADVVLIEKSARIGGSGALSTGPMSINSEFQTALGQTGDMEGVFEKFEELAHWSNKAWIFRKFIGMSGETADWLADHGFVWAESGLTSIPGPYGVTGVGYAEDAVGTMGVYGYFQDMVSDVGTILTETTATEILLDDQGNAVGVKAEKDDGTLVTVNAKAVIMATGGFGGNKEMLEEKVGSPYVLFGLQQNDGSGFEMMLAAGAAEKNSSGYSCHLVTVPGWVSGFDEFDTNIPYALGITPTLMQVNMRGERFASETVSQDEMVMGSNYHAAQGEYYFTLISKTQMDIIKEKGSAGTGMDSKPSTFSFEGQAVQPDVPMPNIEAVLDAAVEQGLAYKGDTLEELAQAAGMQADALIASVERYEELCALGEDLDFNKPAQYMNSLGEGPYYAIKMIPKIYGTLGSVDVDANTQVLREDGSAIGGLYAVGLESIGVLFDGVAYTQIGGVALGWGFNSGRIAAQAAVETLS